MTEKSLAETSPETFHILVVDDDATVRHLMHEFMETVGYRSHMAASGEECLRMLNDLRIDVVITDIMMPGMDGLKMTELIKQRFDVEVIVMTGYSGDYSYEEVIHKGASDFVFKPVRFEELLLRLKRVLKERQLKEELKRKGQELQKLAITDDLTGLYNARYFYQQLQAEVDRAARYRHDLTLMLIDIDHFKNFNDTYGHLEGNNVLSRLGKVIQDCLRRMDSAYRYGGEEFTIILPETSGDQAEHVAGRISSAISSESFCPDHTKKKVHVTVSIGIAEFEIGEDIDGFIRRADLAMYRSKNTGRNRITFLSPAEVAAGNPQNQQESLTP